MNKMWSYVLGTYIGVVVCIISLLFNDNISVIILFSGIILFSPIFIFKLWEEKNVSIRRRK